tara:strand:+ start:200 stop:385 length:186 start_codon:yes stop_codon:yes gene_type:complete
MELIDKITELLDEIKMDGNKFYQKGNKSAGVRARKHAQDLKKILQDLRMDILQKSKDSDGE